MSTQHTRPAVQEKVGNHVPADCRLFDSVNLQIQESALTGESDAIEKQTEAIAGEWLPLGDRTNMAHMGTTVTYGHGQGIVTATGMDTELGHIARSLQTVIPQPTPLQHRLAQLGRGLALIAIGIVALVFAMGMVRGEDPKLMMMTSLSLAVAVVPEGLPAVATVALALGARRMFRRNALIRKLAAVETLGSVTVICSDKTGTLTENRMTVTVLDVAENQLSLDTESIGDLRRITDATNDTALALLLAGAGLCNDAELDTDESSQKIHAIGDPTEGALAIVAAQLGFHKELLAKQFPRTAEVPFDSDRKRMTTIHQIQSGQCQVDSGTVRSAHDAIVGFGNDHIAFTKGAVDSVLEVCKSLWVRGQARPLDDNWKRRILASNEALAGGGMRVLGIAFGPLQTLPASIDATTIEQRLMFVGMLGMIDPPQTEVAGAVARCRSAGIRTIMITGDHPLTATHIAAQLSIANDGKVMTGQEIDAIVEDDLSETVNEVSVLLDDNFATIVGAVEEGRIVYDNIRKFVKYTMTSNSGGIWVMVLGPLMGMPLPLLPLQILWVNLVTDGLPGLALAVEQGERDTMSRPPYPPEEHIFGRGMAMDIAWIGLLMGAVSLTMGYWYWSIGITSDSHWRTMVFTVLTFSQMGNAMAILSSRDSLFQIGVFSNRMMIGSVAVTVALQIAVIYWLPLQQIFKTTALSAGELATCIVLSAIAECQVHGWLCIRDDATSDQTLHDAGIDRARGLAVVLSSDADNLFVVLSARLIAPKLQIIARATDESSAQKMEKAGASRVVSLFTTGAATMAQQLINPTVEDFFEIVSKNGAAIDLAEIRVTAQSPCCHRQLSDTDFHNRGIIIVAVRRATGEILLPPRSTTVLNPDDVLIALGEVSAVSQFLACEDTIPSITKELE